VVVEAGQARGRPDAKSRRAFYIAFLRPFDDQDRCRAACDRINRKEEAAVSVRRMKKAERFCAGNSEPACALPHSGAAGRQPSAVHIPNDD